MNSMGIITNIKNCKYKYVVMNVPNYITFYEGIHTGNDYGVIMEINSSSVLTLYSSSPAKLKKYAEYIEEVEESLEGVELNERYVNSLGE